MPGRTSVCPAVSKRELTEQQFVTWALHMAGESQRGIALRLDVARSTVVDRLDASFRQLRRHGVLVDSHGQPYLPREAAHRV